MTPAERRRRYLERQLELLAAYGKLQHKIEQSVRAGQVDLLAAQAEESRRLADECLQLERALRQLARAGGERLAELEARLEAGRQAALEAGRSARASLSAGLRELADRIRELAARPHLPPSPFTRIGRPMLVDLRS
jgi:hypothetical protein